MKENGFTPFERYLLERLLQSNEDCCAICANCRGLDLCEAILPDGSVSKPICYHGIRKYFDEHRDNAEVDKEEAERIRADRLRDERRDEEALRQLEGEE